MTARKLAQAILDIKLQSDQPEYQDVLRQDIESIIKLCYQHGSAIPIKEEASISASFAEKE